MKIEFDPTKVQEVQSILTMLKADCPRIWDRVQNGEQDIQFEGMSVRTRNICEKYDFRQIVDFSRFTRDEFLTLKNCGNSTVEEIEEKFGPNIWK